MSRGARGRNILTLIAVSQVALTIKVTPKTDRAAALLQNASVAVTSCHCNNSTEPRRHTALTSTIVSKTDNFPVGLQDTRVSTASCHYCDAFEV